MGYLDDMPVAPGTLYVMDRGYIDFRRLRRLADQGAFFVIRARSDVRFYVAASRPVDRSTSLRADQTIRFNGTNAPKHWPGDIRRVSLYDQEHHLRLSLWTNLRDAPASVIAETYRQRWQIELFFRWLKHGLRIQTFYGTSETAVRLQLWTSICVYLAMSITRKQLSIDTNLTTFIQVLSLHALSKAPINELFENHDTKPTASDPGRHSIFNDLK
jgi:IS4 transposase